MKKSLVFAMAVAVVGGSILPACKSGEDLEVYAPDGAPALALAGSIYNEEMRQNELFDFDIVDASMITVHVTGKDPDADLCILPVNAAAKTLGDGSQYALLGTVTNGNLFFLTTGENPTLTRQNLKESLSGKKVGVVQLNNVPGLTLQVVLKDLGVDYRIAQSVEEEVGEGKTNLIPFGPTDVTPAGGCDYYLCPEPALSAKLKGTASTPNPFKMAGDLQVLYGETGGYPQAVLVAKKSVLKRRRADVDLLVEELRAAPDYLKNAEISQILYSLNDKREDGVSPSFNENNLTYEVIERCSVRYTAAKDCKDKINAFLTKLIAVNSESTKLPSDDFYDMG